MRIRIWGARGSIPTPGETTLRYGGNTSCIEVETSRGTLVVIDCGSGAHALGRHLLAARNPPLQGHILISHTHWDHIQGVPFFAPFFARENAWRIYAPRGVSHSLREALAGQMQYTYFPVRLDDLGADITYHELIEGTLPIDDVTVSTRYLNHPALTFAYRLQADGGTFVYASDHEPHTRSAASGKNDFEGEDLKHSDFLRGADLVVHDAQYTTDEYLEKVGWGHSTVEYAVSVCRHAGVKRLALFHHDPTRNDDALDRIVQRARANSQSAVSNIEICAAAEGQEFFVGNGSRLSATASSMVATVDPSSALQNPELLIVGKHQGMVDMLLDAARVDAIHVIRAQDEDEAVRTATQTPPSVMMFEEGTIDLAKTCARLKQLPQVSEVPIIAIAERERGADLPEGVADWLAWPFSLAYARTRMRAWLLRTVPRWQRAAIPNNEAQRLADLHSLGILDSAKEPRFDRLTRLAAGLLGAPMALVSLVDKDRQWFKSAHGLDLNETPRDISFCAHAVASRDVLVVPDALADDRFAENPSVTGTHRVRFYAGYPLFVRDSCIGTLCVLDVRPRQLDPDRLELLCDLAALVEQELRQPPS